MPNSFQEWMNELNRFAKDAHHKGMLFERFMVAYLKTDPVYADKLEAVWQYKDWPDRPDHWNADNLGFDLVARTIDGDYWAIQCKFYDEKSRIHKEAITNFTHDASRKFTVDGEEKAFSYMLFVDTQNDLGRQAEEALNDIENLSVLYLRDMEAAPIDWEKFSWNAPEALTRTPGKSLREHQREALQATLKGFETQDRGKLIMACGTGKTFTSLNIMERMVPEDGLTLFLAPSITLVSQTLREWADQAQKPFDAFVVCSDSKVGQEDEDMRTAELAYPATTSADRLANAIQKTRNNRRKVIFSTYQSIDVVIKAQRIGNLPDFDLVICDEAHRTTGLTLKNKSEDDSDFVKVHQSALLRARKRLYMTATPRIYTEKTRKKADEKEAVLYSMDDEAIYGPEFFNLSFGEAASRGILTEYKVIIVAMREEDMASIANEFNATYKLDEKKGITVEFATRIIGAWKGLSNHNVQVIDGADVTETSNAPAMKRAVGFCKSIKASEQVRDAFGKVVALALQEEGSEDADSPETPHAFLQAKTRHVDGDMNMGERLTLLDWLKEEPESGSCHLLTNARCLSEGVDVPALDAVIFFDARDSMVDIVQSVGRVMRKAPGKDFGYVILPIAIPSTDVANYDAYIDKDPRFQAVWKILKALRAHDERLVDESEYRRRMEVIDGGGGPSHKKKRKSGPSIGGDTIEMPLLPIENIQKALYAVTPKHLGDSEYWASWAKDVAKISRTVIQRIENLIEKREGRAAFNAFLKGIRKNLNSGISEQEAVEMLAQHVLTKPIFEALFGDRSFSAENPVSQAMQRILAVIDKHDVDAETEKLERFYKDVAKRVSLAQSDASKQDLIRNLYDTFFQAAFPELVARLGIVYTPVEIVDFILNSVNEVLKEHFDGDLNSEGVQILDPFTGTGTFITRLIQSDLIKPYALPRKYEKEIHANELVLLAYYIAAINIESAYHAKTLQYKPFNGIVLTDTFQMNERSEKESKDSLGVTDENYLEGNSERAELQKKLDIRVIVGNPPYSAGQKSQNDNNQNMKYPRLDARIEDTYAKLSSAALVKNLYDSYIRAIRWASDRIGDKGVLGFVTNGSFIEKGSMDGLRKGLADDFSHIYVFNLRGFVRGRSGDSAKKEGGNVFNIMTGVAITILIKDPQHSAPAELYYHDTGEYLSREDKLNIIRKAFSIKGLTWNHIQPNEAGDWISQRSEGYEQFMPLGDKQDSKALFNMYSMGVLTSRDAWAYNQSRQDLSDNMQDMIDVSNEDSAKYAQACDGLPKSAWPKVEDIIRSDPEQISWSRALKQNVSRGKQYDFMPESLRTAMYRPFCKQWLYFNRQLNEMVLQIPRLFPTERQENVVITIPGIGSRKGFSCFSTNLIPDLEIMEKSQCFPLFWYETIEEARKRLSKGQDKQANLFAESDGLDGTPDADGYIRRDAITDWALAEFRKHYQDESIEKIDLFHYVYGLLHSPEYRETYAADLSKMIPRIPYAPDFRAFAEAGKKLMDLHLSYEEIEPWPLEEVWTGDKRDYSVQKIRFPKKGEHGSIVYNPSLTLKGIPEEAYVYVVNGKSPVEWVMERYSVRVDKASGIENNPNRMLEEIGNERYIVELIGRVVRVSVETQEIVDRLPSVEES
ncbi:damage-inducible protein [Acidithiobacillus thiooxidans]|uniref:DEAD/DEAH box helicase n=4 Tax=Acidithiobacillus thiooxidans TaxID=930 RepID=UPI000858F121|nr:type ISP restriction/modification enzyme [Acidithiobacillus thiooxidans]OCX83831.1 damage-inducible protein [Acidithiobacillus thiooxidans]OCX86120.1 damage-inducible protein [Acidithiobacillus thiooxidans]